MHERKTKFRKELEGWKERKKILVKVGQRK